MKYLRIILGGILLVIAPAISGYLSTLIDNHNLGYFMSLFLLAIVIGGGGLALIIEELA